FGSILHEMITGRRAFTGENRMSTLSAILREEPKRPSQVSGTVPREVERVVLRCLRKDPARRFQHMDDLKVALEELKEESDSGGLSAGHSGPQAAHVARVCRCWRCCRAGHGRTVVPSALGIHRSQPSE